MGSEPLQKEQFLVSGDVCLEYKRYLCVLLFLFCFSSVFHSLCGGMPAGSGRTQCSYLFISNRFSSWLAINVVKWGQELFYQSLVTHFGWQIREVILIDGFIQFYPMHWLDTQLPNILSPRFSLKRHIYVLQKWVFYSQWDSETLFVKIIKFPFTKSVW